MTTTDSRRRVVVTGLGVVASNGRTVPEFLDSIRNGVSGLVANTPMRDFGFRARAWGACDVPDEAAALPGGRYEQLAITAANEALACAGLTGDPTPERIGVCIASAIAGASRMEEHLLTLVEIESGSNTAQMPGDAIRAFDFGRAAYAVADRARAAGPVSNLSTGCTAGLDAVGLAYETIRDGIADVMLAGASEAPLCPLSVGAFEAIGALSTRETETLTEISTPFSAERDGFVIAEGCGILVLEDRGRAIARGATIYAEIAGYASVNNAYHMTDLPPAGEDMAECIRLALRDAGVSVADIDHISAHGSSTPQNDVNETSAIRKVFGSLADGVPMTSLKSMTGHALAAANAIECVAMCLEMHHGFLHPTINYRTPDPKCDLDYVPNVSRDTRPSVALKLTSGFSGIHSTLIMKAA
jgi:minimal PKS ketosynthase (KS/KS alpha)